ncbi:peptidoglycan-binding protein [Methylobacterium sp. E-046]|uniref:peptidoglycan-binding protein n=1 Tax=Methylobacterium sp. E-046 TaxID=2836576 RepID=UPI001FB9294B|nr:peptidoglycan-binding protein [Methylobacterium sp. E-046]MCJ2102476.1 peptidoglycan-binding protein [Methylobacterium sp. E-046]
MTDWKRILPAVAPGARADLIAAFIAADARIAAAEITTPLRLAHFLAQVATETGGLARLEEGLSYTAERLCKVWPARFPTLAAAKPYARNPKALAEKVYGGRLGNVRPGDGWRYRGGGALQTTGRTNYRAAGFEADPDRLRTPGPALAAALTYWADHDCNALADADDVEALRRRINGGTVGLAECRAYLAKAKAALRVIPAQAKLKALRYPVGAVDGDHGDRTTASVQLLQKKAGLPVTGELDDDTLAALDTAEPLAVPTKDANLAQSRTVQGAGVAGSFGFAEVAQSVSELKDQAESAQAQISAGTVFGFVMGALIVAGALYALYARWDDAGRPVPGFLACRFPKLTGARA